MYVGRNSRHNDNNYFTSWTEQFKRVARTTCVSYCTYYFTTEIYYIVISYNAFSDKIKE